MRDTASFARMSLEHEIPLKVYLIGGAGLVLYAGIRTRWPYPSLSEKDLLQRVIDLHQAGDDQAAYRAAKQLAAKTSRQPAALFWLGALAHRLGKDRTAIRHLKFAAELAPDSVEIWQELGSALQSVGKVREAQAVYQRILTLDPNNIQAREGLESV